MSKVVILGAGVMGSALAVPLTENGHDVRLVGTFLDRDIISAVAEGEPHPGLGRRLPAAVTALQLEDLASAFADVEVVVVGVNSIGVRWAGEQLAQLLAAHHLVIAIAKGMEADDRGALRILPEVLAEATRPELREQIAWCAITGPSIAGEVAARRQSCVVFAGEDQDAVDRLAGTFRTDWYHVWTTTDLVGAEVCAAAKNCFALGVGLATGLIERIGEGASADRAHDLEAALFAQGAAETRRLVALLGGHPETPLWLPGVGDMYVTSTGGRNVRVGRLLGAGLSFSEASERLGNPTLEGAAAIRVIGGALARLREDGRAAADEFPLLTHLHEVIALERPLDLPWERFFGGEPSPRRPGHPAATAG
ncbi:MAG: glycerol-3-phosphate dehydrogenase [Actinomycetota bacterium]|nr:glycerol-3-phosphate dehydrogenase [Actinomycetota bacterium]